MKKARIVVLISGNGSNLQVILDACASGRLAAKVVCVIANKPDAYGLVRAVKANVPTMVITRSQIPGRRQYDAMLADCVVSFDPDYVVLAGWMRLLSSEFLGRFPERVINLHPALPGTFPGTHAIERAYAAWQKSEIDHSGVMVHLVPDEGVDDGPLLAMEKIDFLPGESLEQFESRVHEVEHRLLVETLKKLIETTIV